MKHLLVLLFAMFATVVNAQTRTVTGIVISADDGEPLVGATILPVGATSHGAATDIDGHFTLQVPNSVKKIKVSYVGMKSATVDIKSGTMKIELESTDTRLDEVMVVAYGTAKKSAYTGSASVVKADQIENTVVTDVVSALNGAVAGVQLQSSYGAPGSEPSVRIRGIGSINGSNSPLYVVDGVPYDGAMTSINPDDVASITVLKDAAAAALYGARGANGVILVTTKQGQLGKTKVVIEANWGVNSREIGYYETIRDPRQHVMLTYQAIRNSAYYGELGSQYAGDAEAAHAYANRLVSSNSTRLNPMVYQVFTDPTGNGLIDIDGNFNPEATLGYLYKASTSDESRWFWLTPDNWQTLPFLNGLRQNYTASFSGGNDRYDFFISGAYLSDEGIIKESSFDRISTRFSGNYNITNWLKVGANITYANEVKHNPAYQSGNTTSLNVFMTSNMMAPIYPYYVRNANQEIMKDPLSGNPVYDYGYALLGAPYLTRPLMSAANPGGDLTYNKYKNESSTFNGKWYLQLNPVEGLSVTASLGYWQNHSTNSSINSAIYGWYAQYGGQQINNFIKNHSVNFQALANYNKSWGKNNFDFLLGYESYYASYGNDWVVGDKLLTDDNFSLANIGNVAGSGWGGGYDYYSTRGIFGRINYDFEGRYYVSGSYRRDASSRFSKNHRWGNFFSVSAGWNMAREEFMSEFVNLDILKLKASFGQQGNDNLGNYYAWTNQFLADVVDGNWTISQSYQGNPNLTWETSNAFNAGVDFSFFQGKLEGTLEYFQRTTTNMLYSKSVQPSAGYSSVPDNIGSMRNNGIELELRGTPVRTNDWTWEINFNLTYLKNKILKLAPQYEGQFINGNYIYRDGDPVYQMYLVKYAGVDEEGMAQYWARYEDGTEFRTTNYNIALSGDTSIGAVSNRTTCGSMLPPVYGGVGTTLRWKGIDFSIQCAYQLGGKIYDETYRYLMYNGGYNWAGARAYHIDALKSWSEQNPTSNIPRLDYEAQYPAQTCDRWLTNASYFGINNINVGYNFPTSLISKIKMSGLRVYFAADNVALWCHRKGLDPRVSYTSNTVGSYSALRTVTGGIKVTF